MEHLWRTALQSAIMVMIPTPEPWEAIADLMILGMVTRTAPCSFFGGVEEGGLLASMKRFVPSTCLARAPSFPTGCSHDGDLDATM